MSFINLIDKAWKRTKREGGGDLRSDDGETRQEFRRDGAYDVEARPGEARLVPAEQTNQAERGRNKTRTSPGAAVTMGVTLIALVIMLTYFSLPPEQKPLQRAEAGSAVPGDRRAGGADLPEAARQPRDAHDPAGTSDSQAPSRAGQPASSPAEIEGYKLGGIMQSGDDAHALINNRSCRAGDVIDGARVIRIGQRQVVLEKNGRRIVLGM
jgi:hypothetical protein